MAKKELYWCIYIYIYCDIGLYSFSLLTPDFFICWYPVHYWLHFWPVESRFCSSKRHALLVGSPSFCCPILPELPCRLQHDEVLLLNFLRSISHSYWPHHHLCSLITSLFMLKCWLCARPNSKLGCQNWNNVWLYPNLQFFFLAVVCDRVFLYRAGRPWPTAGGRIQETGLRLLVLRSGLRLLLVICLHIS